MSAAVTAVTSSTPPERSTASSPATGPAGDGEVVLAVDDLTVAFGPAAGDEPGAVDRSIRAVRGVSFQLRRGRTLVLLGESGSGKSVTARAILRLHGSSARIGGAVRFNGDDLAALEPRAMERLRGRELALVPQDPSGALDPLARIGSQIVEVLRHHGMVAGRAGGRVRAEELLDLVGIPDPARVARAYPHQLSGGMRQRAVIAIAVACEPTVLLADEPTTALDVTVQAQILELFVSLQQRLGMAILMVTHDVGVADQIADDVAVMYAGRIVEQGPVTEVLDQPAHPYTRALLASLPQPGVAPGHLRAIPGRAVQAGESLPGCPFAPRCSHAVAACADAEPALVAPPSPRPGSTRTAACSRLAEVIRPDVSPETQETAP